MFACFPRERREALPPSIQARNLHNVHIIRKRYNIILARGLRNFNEAALTR